MKQRKRVIRRMFAGAMAVLMVLSAVNVSGWGMMNAKAEETAVGTTPQYLTIGSTKIIDNGKFQNNEVSGNDTIYQHEESTCTGKCVYFWTYYKYEW